MLQRPELVLVGELLRGDRLRPRRHLQLLLLQVLLNLLGRHLRSVQSGKTVDEGRASRGINVLQTRRSCEARGR